MFLNLHFTFSEISELLFWITVCDTLYTILRASESCSLDDSNRVIFLDTILKLESMNRISSNSCSEGNDFTAATAELSVLSNASITSIILP